MSPVLMILADLLLALGACLRLTRFIVADDVPGAWYVKEPLDRLIHRDKRRDEYERLTLMRDAAIRDGADPDQLVEPIPPPPRTLKRLRWHRYLEGLGCPYCMSVWFAAVVVITLALAGGPGDAAHWWRYGAGFLTLAWLTGHIAARVGDVED